MILRYHHHHHHPPAPAVLRPCGRPGNQHRSDRPWLMVVTLVVAAIFRIALVLYCSSRDSDQQQAREARMWLRQGSRHQHGGICLLRDKNHVVEKMRCFFMQFPAWTYREIRFYFPDLHLMLVIAHAIDYCTVPPDLWAGRDYHSTGCFSSQSSVGPYLPLPPYNTDQDEHEHDDDDDMFSLASGLYTQYFSPQQINLLVVGVQGAGKTTCLERIKVTDFPSKSSTAAVAPLTVEAALSIAGTSSAAALEEHEPLQHQHNRNRKKDTGGPKPELLRTKIFLSENPRDFDAPPRRTHRPRRPGGGTGTDEQPPASRFAWICPPAPTLWVRAANAGANKQDLSDHERDDDDEYDDPDGMDGDDWSEGQWTTGHRSADDDDDDATNCSLRSVLSEDPSQSQPARSRTMVRSNTLPEQPLQHSQHQLHGGGPVGLPAPRRLSLKSSGGGGRMESIDLGGPPAPPPPRRSAAAATTPQEEHSHTNDMSSSLPPLHQPLPHQYDLKPGAKMLPLEKIRPTIGMNLAKTQVCGAQVHVFDVSGKLQNLWERYYADADAVLFVWKLERNDNDDDDPSSRGNGDDDDSERPATVTPEQQKRVLEQVRSAVADDIPFAVLGHLFQPDPPYNCEPDVLYSTSQLLPHYHNPYQALFVGNAVTGQGLKTCLEWLIGAAKRQKRIRERQADDRIMMKH